MHGRWSRKTTLGVILSLLLLLILSIPVYALIGDINLDDLVNASDLAAIVQSLGTYQNDPTYNRFRDLNQDNNVDVADLAIAGRSYGSTRNFHYPRQISNSSHNVIYMSSCIDASDRIHIAWSESDNVYYTRLDRFGNTLIDDLLLEHGGFAGNDAVAIGCDDVGNSYMIWDCADAVDGTCQARIDRYGYRVLGGRLDTQRRAINYPAVDLDSSGRAHVFYTRDVVGKSFYSVVNPDGKLQISQQILPVVRRYHELVVDQDDNAHLLYPVYTDTTRLAYQRIGFGVTPSLSPRTIGVLGWEGGYNDSIRPSLAVDADHNVFASYFTFSTLPMNLYLEKLNQDGNSIIDDKLIFPEYDNGANGMAQTDIALDSIGNLHMVSFTDFNTGTGAAHTAYGIFDNDTEILQSMRWIIYGGVIENPTLLLDSQNEAQLIYEANDSSGYPPCGSNKLCYHGTSFETNTYNRSLPDLGSDVAHLYWDPFILRWNAPLVITGTVFNAGWYTATATTIRVSVAISDTDPSPLATTDVAIPSLKPYGNYQFQANLEMPHDPPPGFERLKFLRLKLDVDPTHLIAETTETNNHTSSPVPVEPIPTQTKLYAVIRDDTYTVLGDPNASELVNTGLATIAGLGYPEKDIEVTDYSTVLASDIPVSPTVISYTIGWKGKNYRDPAPVQIGVKRNPGDPYKIDYTPMNTAVLVTDRWASLSGTITKSDGGGGALAGAKVRLVGQGLSLEATTDGSGNYSPSTLAALAKLIPGEYQVRLSRANHARQVDTLSIGPLEAATFSRVMEPTEFAYLHGNVINEFGNPVRQAQVDVCLPEPIYTDDQGVFDMEVKADCKLLEISRQYYANASQTLTMTAGLETVLNNLTLIFDPPVTVKGGGDRVASRVIDESTGGLLPDAPPDAGFALTKLYEQFKSKYWIDYRIIVLYGCYEYNLSAMYSGSIEDGQLKLVQLSLAPKTFEVHMSLGSISVEGITIPIPIVSDSGLRTALYAIEVRLVNGKTGKPIVPAIRNPLEGGSSLVLDDTIKTYDFGGASFTSDDNPEVWFYLKAGLNSGGFDPSPLLYQYNQQILKLNLDTGEIYGSYELGAFPSP
jgi:hypothetical protein